MMLPNGEFRVRDTLAGMSLVSMYNTVGNRPQRRTYMRVRNALQMADGGLGHLNMRALFKSETFTDIGYSIREVVNHNPAWKESAG